MLSLSLCANRGRCRLPRLRPSGGSLTSGRGFAVTGRGRRAFGSGWLRLGFFVPFRFRMRRGFGRALALFFFLLGLFDFVFDSSKVLQDFRAVFWCFSLAA